MLFVSISVYAVDTFTAINLLAFNRWAGQIKPEVDLKYSRWIFAGCIILSFVLLIYRWLKALKVMRGGKVAKAYLDPLAVRVECIRMGKEGRGWKRFLVFAELTKSRKGADYVALFAYYSFEAWLRILFAEGPRVVINGMTLYAYAEANFIPTGEHSAPEGESPVIQFWKNVGVLAEEDQLQAAIIFGMLWTCLIWIISFVSLAVSVVLYLLFLWHHIPSDAGGLSGYCRTKINRRMERIVKTKVDKALKKENEIRARQEARAFREGIKDFKRQPTLPDVATGSTSSLPSLSRQTTMTTLPEYTSRPGTAQPSDDALPPMPLPPTPIDSVSMKSRPGHPSRHVTSLSSTSWSSYNSNAPLMGSAGDMSYSPADRVQTPASALSTPWSARPSSNRNFSGFTDFPDARSHTSGPTRPSTAQSHRGMPSASYQMEPLPRPGTGMSQRSRPRGMSNDAAETMPPAQMRNMTPVSAYPQSAASMHAPTLPDMSRPGTSMSQRSRGRGYSNEAPDFVQMGPSRHMTPTSAHPSSATSMDGFILPEIARPGTSASYRSRGRGYSNEGPEMAPPAPSWNMTPISTTSANGPMFPDPHRTRTLAPSHNQYLPPVSPIPEMDDREPPAFPGAASSRPYTPTGAPPQTNNFGRALPLPRLRTPSNGGNEGGYIAYNPTQESTAPPPAYSYESSHSYNPTPTESNPRSFSRPFGNPPGPSASQEDKLHPPKPDPPKRGGSFDDILDHY